MISPVVKGFIGLGIVGTGVTATVLSIPKNKPTSKLVVHSTIENDVNLEKINPIEDIPEYYEQPPSEEDAKYNEALQKAVDECGVPKEDESKTNEWKKCTERIGIR